MEQKGLFEEEEEGKSAGDTEAGGEELEDLFGKEPEEPKKSNLKLFLLIGLVLVAGGYIATLFLFKGEKPVAPEVAKIPIKGAPGMANVTGTKAVMAKQEVTEKVEAKEKPKVEVKVEEKKPEPKPEVKKPVEAKVAKKEEVAPKAEKPAPAVEKAMAKGLTVTIGTYTTKYDLEAAKDTLKGTGIRHSSKEAKKKLMMNRVLVGEVKGKGEVNRLISELKGKGYDPFPIHINGNYKVYAVSNLNEEISKNNKADLEKLGYTPSIEKKEVAARIYELSVVAKNKNEIGELSVRLKKLGFEPEIK
ncbi:MAG: SPOR domain-containing protein [Deltaproteobacteria bacterium]